MHEDDKGKQVICGDHKNVLATFSFASKDTIKMVSKIHGCHCIVFAFRQSNKHWWQSDNGSGLHFMNAQPSFLKLLT